MKLVFHIAPWWSRRTALKVRSLWLRSVSRVMTGLPPFGAVFDDPISQRSFESDVVPRLRGFDPFVTEYLLTFRLELAVQGRVLQKIAGHI